LDKIYELIGSNSLYPFNATAMIYNSSNTQYQITTKIKEIIEKLMIEQWNDQISFNAYYEQCNPSFCIYTYNKQGDMAYMITTTIGLIGGLTTILRIVIPLIVAFIRRKKRPKPIETEINGK
jgi:flagellar motor switch protein FliM